MSLFEDDTNNETSLFSTQLPDLVDVDPMSASLDGYYGH